MAAMPLVTVGMPVVVPARLSVLVTVGLPVVVPVIVIVGALPVVVMVAALPAGAPSMSPSPALAQQPVAVAGPWARQ